MTPILDWVASVVAVGAVTVTVLLLLNYKAKYEAINAKYGDAMQQVINGSAARQQAVQEFINLKSVVQAWQERPVLANLTDQQIHFIINSVAGLITSQSKDPNHLN